MLSRLEAFGREEFERASVLQQGILSFLVEDLSRPEVSEFRVSSTVQENVLWLQIAVHHLLAMEICNRFNDLLRILPDVLF